MKNNKRIVELETENAKLKKDLQLLSDGIAADGKKITVVRPRIEKITYKKWVRLGEKKYFEKFFPSHEEVMEAFSLGLSNSKNEGYNHP